MKPFKNLHITIAVLAITLFFSFYFRPAVSRAEDTLIKIGVFADEGNETCHRRWDATADHLSGLMPGFKFQIVPVMFNDLRTHLEAGTIAFLICDPQIFAEVQAEFRAFCLATMKTEHGGKTSSECGSVVFVRKSSGIKTFQELKNKKFLASHPGSLGGWSAAMHELKKESVTPETDFASFNFAGASELSVIAVLNGISDAGSVKTGALEKLEEAGKIKISDLRILKPANFKEKPDFPYALSTELYPHWAFACFPKTKSELAEKAAGIILKIKAEDKAAKDAGISGWDAPRDYSAVADVLKDIEIGYFAMLRNMTPLKLIKRHIYKVLALIGFIAFLLIALAYVLRNNRIITEARKTIEKELEERKKIESERQLKREFQSIIAEALQLFFVIEDFNDCFQMVFERVSRRLKLHRVLIFEDVSPKSAKIIYQFNAGAAPLVSEKFDYAGLPSWKKCLVEEVMINYPQNASLHEEIKSYISALGAGQLLSLPLYINNAYSGFIIFSCAESDPLWDEYVISLLFPLTNVLSATLEKKRNIENLRQLIGTKDKFLTILAHDLKSPMASFSMLIDMLRTNMLGEEKKNLTLDGIKDSISTVIKLIDSVVMWAKMQSGEITASRASVSIDSFIEPNVSLLSGPASNKNITLEYQKCDLTAFADSSMMLAVVRNLINNAIKFTRPGGTVKISACLAGEFVKITVEDDGLGMNKATMEKLFKIGEKIVSLGTAGERGSGFGLILCHDFVIKNGGEMIVESEEGRGSRFCFTLPAEEGCGEALNKSAEAKAR